VDIGAGDGYHLSNTAYFRQLNWAGLAIDADNKGSEWVLKAFITKENIAELLKWYILHGFDLLSIDIDGNDYWVLDEILTHVKPKVICFEINSEIPLGKGLVMPYDPNHKWDGTNAFGMSYTAGFLLCAKHRYQIYDIVNSTNIIAVRSDIPILRNNYEYHQTKSHPHKEIDWIKI